VIESNTLFKRRLIMIDEIDYFPKRERHNKKKKVDSGWGDLKKQKNKQEANPSDEPPLSEKKPHEKKRN
jgi:hypothetical protein